MHKGKDQAPCMQLRLVSHGDLFFNDRARNAHPVNLAPHDNEMNETKENQRNQRKSKKIKSKKSNQGKSNQRKSKKRKEKKRKEMNYVHVQVYVHICNFCWSKTNFHRMKMFVPSCTYRVLLTVRVE